MTPAESGGVVSLLAALMREFSSNKDVKGNELGLTVRALDAESCGLFDGLFDGLNDGLADGDLDTLLEGDGEAVGTGGHDAKGS